RGGRGALPSSPAGGPGDRRSLIALSRVRAEDTVHRRLGRTGYTAFGWLPDASGFIAGQASVLRPRTGKEKTPPDLSLKESAYLFASFEMGKRWRDAVEGELRKAADTVMKEEEAKKKEEEARKAAEAKPAEKKADDAKPDEKKPDEKKPDEKKPEEKKPDERKPANPPAAPAAAPAAPAAKPVPPDALSDVFRGQRRLLLRVRSPAAIDHLLRILDGLPKKPRVVLVLPSLPPATVQKLLERRDIIDGVILAPSLGTASETSVLVPAARLFAEGGLDVAFTPLADSIAGHASIPLHLAEMVKAGMSPGTVLAAVTTIPARYLGLEGKVGSLEKGASASFAVHDGDVLGGSARLLAVYVEGIQVFSDDAATSRVAGEAVK
ncbi:MAG TPA: amidohydrolase family protein, partial [Planctomycetota bacterium]|nr:amidohydrolase family protein [Planctomycetota bacterium]